MLKGKTVLLGVTGGIAAYKSATLASLLVKAGADVHVLMTENAKHFVNPITFETLTGNRCISDTFARDFQPEVKHVALAKRADVMMIAPATANVMAKLAAGIADDMLTTTALAFTKKILVAPAMNTAMYENVMTQRNMETLAQAGMEIITPASGRLACGDVGAGKMPEPEMLFEYIVRELAYPKDLLGKNILVTAGPTQEAIDPVRYLTNHSSGKMGYSIAKVAACRGAEVTLVSGQVALETPLFVEKVSVVSARDMYEAVTERASAMDIVIKAAAVADYRPKTVAEEKVKKKDGELSIELERTDDIIGTLGKMDVENRPFLCGFSMETEHMLENSREKLKKKNLDMIVANNVKVAGAGFATDTNIVTIITKEGVKELPIMSKDGVADVLLTEIAAKL